MNTQTQKFECWSIVELMGHQQMAGHVTEQTFGPATFFRVTVPATSEGPAFDRLINPASIYAINPVTEEVARARAEQIKFKPITGWDIREIMKQIPNETAQHQIEGGQDVYNEDDDDDLPM